MRSVRVTVTLTESAALGVASRADHRQDTYDHVPGSVLRGALAATWLRTPGAPGADDARFREVFEGDGAFGPLHSAESLPTPLSVWTHKGKPGQRCLRLWWDEIDDAAPETCPTCSKPLVQSKGQPIGTPEIGARTRVALDADGVAMDGMLFRRAGLVTGTVLSGWVSGVAVAALTPAGVPVTGLRLGGQRGTRGLAEIRFEDAVPPAPEADGDIVVLRLASPGVFVDPFGCPVVTPSREEITKVLGVKVKKMEKGETGRPWTRWTEVGGWHMASGLPKPRDRAVAAGSTYRVVCVEAPAADRLAELAARGVGLRRREGYGALCIPPQPALRGTPVHTATAAAVSWPGWPEFRSQLLKRATGRPARIILPSLADVTEQQRSALEALLAVKDLRRLPRLLDELGPR